MTSAMPLNHHNEKQLKSHREELKPGIKPTT